MSSNNSFEKKKKKKLPTNYLLIKYILKNMCVCGGEDLPA